MKTKRIIGITIFVILLIMLILLVCNNIYCMDKTHKGKYIVNPYCTKCHGKDGIVQHKCDNPNGIDKYCSVCGKIVIK